MQAGSYFSFPAAHGPFLFVLPRNSGKLPDSACSHAGRPYVIFIRFLLGKRHASMRLVLFSGSFPAGSQNSTHKTRPPFPVPCMVAHAVQRKGGLSLIVPFPVGGTELLLVRTHTILRFRRRRSSLLLLRHPAGIQEMRCPASPSSP